MSSTFYLILMLVNIFYLTDFKYSFIVAFFTYLFSILSYNYFGYHIIEMWCFFGAFLPLIIFSLQDIYYNMFYYSLSDKILFC